MWRGGCKTQTRNGGLTEKDLRYVEQYGTRLDLKMWEDGKEMYVRTTWWDKSSRLWLPYLHILSTFNADTQNKAVLASLDGRNKVLLSFTIIILYFVEILIFNEGQSFFSSSLYCSLPYTAITEFQFTIFLTEVLLWMFFLIGHMMLLLPLH